MIVKQEDISDMSQKTVYDNSNIAESYAGVTTPLTFSFVRYVYQEVYMHFSSMMGVSSRCVSKHSNVFEHMVEFIGYRVYYNLSNWYTLLSFFPGYRYSSEFMEKMMGVEEGVSRNRGVRYSWVEKYCIYLPKTILSFIKISFVFMSLSWRMPRFNTYFDRTFHKLRMRDLHGSSPKELHEIYKEADRKLLRHWRVPIANDFAVMVSTGLANMLFKHWLGSNDAYMYMHPKTRKPLVSLDAGGRLVAIVEDIQRDDSILELFIKTDPKEIYDTLFGEYSQSRVALSISLYLEDFGTRIPNELKLESETLIEDPVRLITLIQKNLEGRNKESVQDKKPLDDSVYTGLPIYKKCTLSFLLNWAGHSIHRREEARFRRALIFGFIRNIFLAVGKKLKDAGVIVHVRDIFYLTTDEVFDLAHGNKNMQPQDLIDERKKEYGQWEGVATPRRIESDRSIKHIEKKLLEQTTAPSTHSGNVLQGTVASKPIDTEVCEGVALTLKNFEPQADYNGKILVTCQTDPGWVVVFPLLKGIVVERGGMLSHAAIVARELNIPCIVGVNKATDIVVNDAHISLDLKKGLITQHTS